MQLLLLAMFIFVYIFFSLTLIRFYSSLYAINKFAIFTYTSDLHILYYLVVEETYDLQRTGACDFYFIKIHINNLPTDREGNIVNVMHVCLEDVWIEKICKELKIIFFRVS